MKGDKPGSQVSQEVLWPEEQLEQDLKELVFPKHSKQLLFLE